jgi:hypothetical protein
VRQVCFLIPSQSPSKTNRRAWTCFREEGRWVLCCYDFNLRNAQPDSWAVQHSETVTAEVTASICSHGQWGPCSDPAQGTWILSGLSSSGSFQCVAGKTPNFISQRMNDMGILAASFRPVSQNLRVPDMGQGLPSNQTRQNSLPSRSLYLECVCWGTADRKPNK